MKSCNAPIKPEVVAQQVYNRLELAGIPVIGWAVTEPFGDYPSEIRVDTVEEVLYVEDPECPHWGCLNFTEYIDAYFEMLEAYK